MAKDFYPTEDRLLIKKDKFVAKESKTKLHLSDEVKKELLKDEKGLRTETGIVIAAGKGRYTNDGSFIPLDIKRDERVVFDSRAGIRVTGAPEDVYIMRSSEILAVIRDKE